MYESHPTQAINRSPFHNYTLSLIQERQFTVQQAADGEAELNSVLEKQKADMKALEVHFMDAKQDLERSKSWYLRVV